MVRRIPAAQCQSEIRRAFFLALLLLIIASAAFAQVTIGGTLPGPLPLFPADNWWNNDVTSAPLDTNSAAFINFIGPARSLHPDLGGDVSGVPSDGTYGIPYVVVPGTQPMRIVTFDYADESDYQLPGLPPGYPIPDAAINGYKYIEGGLRGIDPPDSDRHMLLVDRDHRVLFELYYLRYNTSTSSWEAGSGAIFPLDSNLRRPPGWTSADAAGLAILPGLIRYDEAFGTAPIKHAFRVTLRATDGQVYPASHTAGSTSGALPMGARLRLKASVNISGYPPEVQKIFQAMKTYGLIVADNGSDMYITGTYDTRWNNDVLNPAFASLHASDFEVIQRGWKPSSGGCTRISISQQPRGGSVAPGGTLTLSVVASGTTPIAYQWYRGSSGDTSSAIQGATMSSVQVSPSTTSSYWVQLTNSCSTMNSAAATVTVTTCNAPVITSQPSGDRVRRGTVVVLSVVATGTAPLTYDWYKRSGGSWVKVASGASNSYTTPPISQTTSYRVDVSNACGTTSSSVATLLVGGHRRLVRR